jgi:signal transduction histidine kinase
VTERAPATEELERRLLVLAPVGKDAALIESMLREDAVRCVACPDVACLEEELRHGAAALLVTEEALPRDGLLAGLIEGQPAWSDLPVLLLTRTGADSGVVAHALQTLGNVTVLERPVRVTALASAVRSALRARERQYQTRAHLREREEADRRKDEFLAVLAHELRNPLAPIRNSVALLRLSGASAPIGPAWEMIDRQIDHMVRLIDDLMEVSRITRGKIDLRIAPLDLREVIGAAIEASRQLLEGAGLALEVSLPEQPLVVKADATRMSQVFSNLINNAVRYTDPGGRISLSARREDNAIVVTLKDTGIGIRPDALAHVFDMFMQVDTRARHGQVGLGIGLTLVRSLVELHGGMVEASSEGEGRGSEFVVRLPVSARGLGPAPADVAAPSALPGLPRIMVVDDNLDAAQSLAALLKFLGAEVRVANDGVAALEALAPFRPAAVFLDLGMPGMDGFETARRMRALPESRDMKIVALTGWGQDSDRRRTEAAGFNHHLVKPADISALQAVLSSLETGAPS